MAFNRRKMGDQLCAQPAPGKADVRSRSEGDISARPASRPLCSRKRKLPHPSLVGGTAVFSAIGVVSVIGELSHDRAVYV